MSYQIYYSRAYIKVGDDAYMPMMQDGSNNCFEVRWNRNGREYEIPEKNWGVRNYPHHGKFIFTAAELTEWAKQYDAYGDHFKSRHTTFRPGEMARWLINGMKTARTLEEYLSYGNTFTVMDWTDWDNKKYYYPKTTAELLQVINDNAGIEHLAFHFNERELRLPKPLKILQPRQQQKVSQYYVLYNPDTGSLVKLTRRGYRYSYSDYGGKKFADAKTATRYLQKNAARLPDFTVREIQREAYV